MEVRDKGDSFCDCTCCNEYINYLQGSSSSMTVVGGLLVIDLKISQKIIPFGGFIDL